MGSAFSRVFKISEDQSILKDNRLSFLFLWDQGCAYEKLWLREYKIKDEMHETDEVTCHVNENVNVNVNVNVNPIEVEVEHKDNEEFAAVQENGEQVVLAAPMVVEENKVDNDIFQPETGNNPQGNETQKHDDNELIQTVQADTIEQSPPPKHMDADMVLTKEKKCEISQENAEEEILPEKELVFLETQKPNNPRIEKIAFELSIVNKDEKSAHEFFEIEIYLNEHEEEKLLGKMKSEKIGSQYFFNFSPTVEYSLGKNQRIKILLKSSTGRVFEIRTILGKLIGSSHREMIIPINEDNVEYNYENLQDVSLESSQFDLHLCAKGIENEDKINSYLGVTMTLGLPIFPWKILRYVLKAENHNIYTSEKQKSNKVFQFFNPLIPVETFVRANAMYSVEFTDENGSVIYCVNGIRYDDFVGQKEFPLISFETRRKCGKVQFAYKEAVPVKFLSQIEQGLQISLIVGIDYTSSNIEHTNPKSLHYLSPNATELNIYQKAILGCGTTLSYYDNDQLYPLFGFGGIPPDSHDVSHCFHLNFSSQPEVKGIDGILDTYQNSLKSISMQGPTYFAPLIRNVLEKIIKTNQSKKNYYVLMIITDGQIDDMTETVDIIVEASRYPFSIIIIGVGEEDFSKMKILDGDIEPLISSKGEMRMRDIVQFVTFSQYSKYSGVFEKLKEEVLSEIPGQIESYFNLHVFE